MVLALIVDIVGSRELDDRERAQSSIMHAFHRADEVFPADTPLWATVGDEFQALYADIGAALGATALARLVLPDGVDCRFGLGHGEVRDITVADGGRPIQDGSAWWSAREAIETARRHESHGHPYLRTWFSSGADDPAHQVAAINAVLLQRDQAISRMKARERRLAAALLAGRPQHDIAREEGISQPAVSQNLQRSGATALAAGLDLFRRGERL